MKTFKIFILVLLLSSFHSFAQYWEIIYRENGNAEAKTAIESYDKGLYIGLTDNALQKLALLLKTDVNGKVLWQKKIGMSGFMNGITGICQAKDGGLLVCGLITSKDEEGDAFLLKLNACGEKEWAKIYYDSGYNWAKSIMQLPDGNYLLSIYNEKIEGTLLKLDTSGKVIWQFTSEHGFKDVLLNYDNSFLISVDCFLPLHNNPDTGTAWGRGGITKLKQNGKQDFFKVYYYEEDSLIRFQSARQMQDSGWIVAGWNRNSEYIVERLFRYDKNGNVILSKRYSNGRNYHEAFINILPINDKESIILSEISDKVDKGWVKFTKVDENGKVLKFKEFKNEGAGYLFPGSFQKTSDNKFLFSGYYNNGGYVLKLNENLDIDSFTTKAYRYDSLCPKSISNSTISIADAEIIPVNLDSPTVGKYPTALPRLPEFFTSGNTIYPNPVQDLLHWRISSGTQKLLTAKVYFYNMLGQEISANIISTSENEIQVSTKHFPAGVYMGLLEVNGKVIARQKLLKR